ncbi:MAG: DUF2066 domain-containing protein [Kangiellaceae bacterium]|jgi:hypothetical protein|nr:DUF2066 domain-containing protein [Kangiellaceae bacterium]
MLARLLAVSVIALSLPAAMGQENDLYVVEWPVPNRTNSAQNNALIASFKEVIVRASGSARALDAFYVQEAYKKANSYIRTFQYQDNGDNEELPLKLIFQFDPVAVQNLLQDSALPMWSGSQPVSLIWLSYENNFQRELISTNTASDNPVYQSVIDNKIRRGLPVILPLMDLDDQMNVSISDIWGQFPEPILNASQRYGAEAVIAGRLFQQGQGFEGSFMLSINNQIKYQNFLADDQQTVIASMTDWLGEQLCNQFCVREVVSNNDNWQLMVKDVGGFASYRALMDYLESLAAIRNVEVSRLNKRTLILDVDLVGDINSLTQAIDLDQKLIAETDQVRKESMLIEFLSRGQSKEESPSAEMVNPSVSESNSIPALDLANTENNTEQTITNLDKVLVYYWRP